MRPRIVALSTVGTLALLALAGCGAADPSNSNAVASSTDPTTTNVAATFTLSEWTIALDGTIPPGTVAVKADNTGREKHELVIVAAKDAAALPKKPDGSVDEDGIPEGDKVGETGDIPARTSTTKTFTFKPGSYVAFCNIVDDMGMAGGNMMNGGASGSMMGGNAGGSMMGGDGASTPMGSTMGHVHFVLGMATPFTVR